MLTFKQIKELIELVGQRGLQGIEIEAAEFRLKIEGQAVSPPVAAAAAPLAPPSVAPTLAAAPVAAPPQAATAEAAEGGLPEDAHILNSPIVGTFYVAPSPDSEPYARIGDRVEKGQVLCIVEAMKLMNEIESDLDGIVLDIFPKNAQPVEFGEPLFAIQPR